MDILTPKPFILIVLGAIASWLSNVWVFVALTFAVMILDYISGMIAGRANEGLNSKKAIKGLYKKMGILLLLGLGLFLDGAINYFMHEEIHFFEMPFDLPIAHITTIWIVITEAISICENLERSGVPIPNWLLKLLNNAEKKMNAEQEQSQIAELPQPMDCPNITKEEKFE